MEGMEIKCSNALLPYGIESPAIRDAPCTASKYKDNSAVLGRLDNSNALKFLQARHLTPHIVHAAFPGCCHQPPTYHGRLLPRIGG